MCLEFLKCCVVYEYDVYSVDYFIFCDDLVLCGLFGCVVGVLRFIVFYGLVFLFEIVVVIGLLKSFVYCMI